MLQYQGWTDFNCINKSHYPVLVQFAILISIMTSNTFTIHSFVLGKNITITLQLLPWSCLQSWWGKRTFSIISPINQCLWSGELICLLVHIQSDCHTSPEGHCVFPHLLWSKFSALSVSHKFYQKDGIKMRWNNSVAFSCLGFRRTSSISFPSLSFRTPWIQHQKHHN